MMAPYYSEVILSWDPNNGYCEGSLGPLRPLSFIF